MSITNGLLADCNTCGKVEFKDIASLDRGDTRENRMYGDGAYENFFPDWWIMSKAKTTICPVCVSKIAQILTMVPGELLPLPDEPVEKPYDPRHVEGE